MSNCPLIDKPCKRDSCEWYQNGSQKCAVLVLTEQQDCIINTLEEMSEKLNKKSQ